MIVVLMRVIYSKNMKEKMAKIIMSKEEYNKFLMGLEKMRELTDTEYIDNVINAIEKSTKLFVPYDENDKDIPEDSLTFVLFEREQRTCAFYYLMFINILPEILEDTNTAMEVIIDRYMKDYEELYKENLKLKNEVEKYKAVIGTGGEESGSSN